MSRVLSWGFDKDTIDNIVSDLLMGEGMSNVRNLTIKTRGLTKVVDQFDDGHYEIEVCGFGSDDLDINVSNNLATFNFANDAGDVLDFTIKLPENVTDINLSINKGVMHMTLDFKPCDINVNFI